LIGHLLARISHQPAGRSLVSAPFGVKDSFTTWDGLPKGSL